MRTLPRISLCLLLLTSPSLAAAELHEVRMLNKSASGPMSYEPGYLKIAAGDSVRFVATDKSHNVETIAKMLPEGATPFKGDLNEEIEVTFDVEGIYGLKCAPHYAMGMVMIVQVGDAPATLEDLPAKLPSRTRKRLIGYVQAQAE
ncbi:pseudoazurin [Shimia haliotis]|uniref:Pseudoazurin n=1 Tax=Shimia haliotis TaxID=1280847 RepID=A0A1I4EVP6_9RHOB|nr:pseudoazurin [Shimia haliotis]SFL09788.1 pseudoazurin [Shimia haliotis]